MAEPIMSPVQLQLDSGKSLWVLQHALVVMDDGWITAGNTQLPSRTAAGQSPATALVLYKNAAANPLRICLAATSTSHLLALASCGGLKNNHALDGNGSLAIVLRTPAFLAAEDSVKIAACEPVFNADMDEPEEWLGIGGPGTVIVSSSGPTYSVAVDGEYLINTDNLICYSKSLAIAAAPPKNIPHGKRTNRSRIFRFSGRGMVWCQSNNAAIMLDLLTPYLKRGSA